MNGFECCILGVCIVLILGLMNNAVISQKLAQIIVRRRTESR